MALFGGLDLCKGWTKLLISIRSRTLFTLGCFAYFKLNFETSECDKDENTNVENNKLKSKRAILCVGSTGTGKSTTIKIMTERNEITTGSSAKSVTQECSIYYPKFKLKEAAVDVFNLGISDANEELRFADIPWIDTPGWDDPKYWDSETFKRNLNFLKSKSVNSLQAIIWCVSPNMRCTSTLEMQAKFIQEFSTGDRNIWENVIIVSRETAHPKLVDKHCQGALEAADTAARADVKNVFQPKLMGYNITEAELFQVNLEDLKLKHENRCLKEQNSSDLKETHHFVNQVEACERCKPEYTKLKDSLNVKSDEEIQDNLWHQIGKLHPVQIIFKNTECLACGEIDDHRLMSDFCHFGKSRGHPSKLARTHLKMETNHPNPKPVLHHPGERIVSIKNYFTLTAYSTWSCCPDWIGQSSETKGCMKKWQCCGKDFDPGNFEECKKENIMYSCCQQKTHRENAQRRHPGKKEFRYEFSWMNPLNFERYYDCCAKKANEEGCKDFYVCCDTFQYERMPCVVVNQNNYHKDGCSWKYTCCDKSAGDEACADICANRKCGKRWGETAVDKEEQPCYRLQALPNGSMEKHREITECHDNKIREKYDDTNLEHTDKQEIK